MLEKQVQPRMKQTQEVIKNFKQNTMIRKITVQSISPVIHKLQERINELLDESKKLKNQNFLIQGILKTNNDLQEEVTTMKKNIFSQKQELNKEQSHNMQRLSQDLRNIKENITKLNENTGKLTQQNIQMKEKVRIKLQYIQDNQSNIKDLIDNISSKLSQYNRQSVIKIQGLQINTQDNQLNLNKLQQNQQKHSENIINLISTVNILEKQRPMIKQKLEQAYQLGQISLKIDEYEKQKATQNHKFQSLQKNVQQMLDNALTPQVRKFLPMIIEKTSLFNDLMIQLKQLQTEVQTLNHTTKYQEQNINKINLQFISHNHLSYQQSLEQQKLLLQKQINQHKQTLKQQIQAQKNIWTQITIIDKKYQQKINTFIENNKQEIYQIMKQMKPITEINQENRLKQKMYELQPIMQNFTTDMNTRCNEILVLGETLDQKLAKFAHQIVKIKADVVLSSQKSYRNSQILQNKLLYQEQHNNHVSILLSNYLQIFMIQLAVSMEPADNIYLTNNDGVIYENKSKSTTHLNYRKNMINRPLIKKSLFNCLTKLIDKIITEKQILKWNRYKPSSFFHQIVKKQYQYLLQLYQSDQKYDKNIYKKNRLQSNSIQETKVENTEKKQNKTELPSLSKTINFENSTKMNKISKAHKNHILDQPRKSTPKANKTNLKQRISSIKPNQTDLIKQQNRYPQYH